jgi:hypothetical protein
MRRRTSARTGARTGAAVCLALALAGPSLAAGGAAGKWIAAADAAQHVGEEAAVCGSVAGAKYAAQTRGRPTFLDFEKPYPGEVFRVVIWGSDRAKFKDPPERMYARKNVCVTGRIQLYRGSPEIIVHDPAQLSLDSPARVGGTHSRRGPEGIALAASFSLAPGGDIAGQASGGSPRPPRRKS